jgi:hypothetical protein
LAERAVKAAESAMKEAAKENLKIAEDIRREIPAWIWGV